MAEPSANVELGDAAYGSDPDVITIESNGSGSSGDAVTINGSGQVAPTAATDDDFIGILAEDSPAAGETVSVYVSGVVVANVAGSVAAGEVLEPSATAGQLTTNATGTTRAVDEGGSATYTLAMEHPKSLTPAGGMGGLSHGAGLGTNAAVVKLP